MTSQVTDPDLPDALGDDRGVVDAAVADVATVQETLLVAPLARPLWLALGLMCVALGALGIVVPGLPTTVFFIVAAWAFTKSSPRLEAWVLGLPGIGRSVRDHRAGLGMPRRVKVVAVLCVVVFAGSAVLWAIDLTWLRLVVGAVAVAGIVTICHQPTRPA